MLPAAGQHCGQVFSPPERQLQDPGPCSPCPWLAALQGHSSPHMPTPRPRPAPRYSASTCFASVRQARSQTPPSHAGREAALVVPSTGQFELRPSAEGAARSGSIPQRRWQISAACHAPVMWRANLGERPAPNSAAMARAYPRGIYPRGDLAAYALCRQARADKKTGDGESPASRDGRALVSSLDHRPPTTTGTTASTSRRRTGISMILASFRWLALSTCEKSLELPRCFGCCFAGVTSKLFVPNYRQCWGVHGCRCFTGDGGRD